MSENTNGGPAFPLPLGTANMAEPSESGGMTLRDYFAAKAMQGYLASFDPHGEPVEYATRIAEDAYTLADAMLKARESATQAMGMEKTPALPVPAPQPAPPTCVNGCEYQPDGKGGYACVSCGDWLPF